MSKLLYFRDPIRGFDMTSNQYDEVSPSSHGVYLGPDVAGLLAGFPLQISVTLVCWKAADPDLTAQPRAKRPRSGATTAAAGKPSKWMGKFKRRT